MMSRSLKILMLTGALGGLTSSAPSTAHAARWDGGYPACASDSLRPCSAPGSARPVATCRLVPEVGRPAGRPARRPKASGQSKSRDGV